MNILVTGGAGYIGSHTALQLLLAGYEVIVVDNLSNSNKTSLLRVQQLANKSLTFVEADVTDREALRSIFKQYDIAAVIHFAGLKSIGQSVSVPQLYYENNVQGSLSLFAIMNEFSVKTLVFSSSASVYGSHAQVPIKEDAPTSVNNPYARSKLMVEEILKDLKQADDTWRVAILRYFNPIGAHHSGQIGEDPQETPNNLLPYVAQVAVGRLSQLNVFGADYPTPDGTGIRDYIHVMDLADGHIAALDYLVKNAALVTLNLGTGKGSSVLEVVNAFEEASGRTIQYAIKPRRPNDAAINFADVTLAKELLGWQAKRALNEMCVDAWLWQSNNKNGYE